MGAGEIVNRRDQKWRKRERWWDRISWSLSQEKENWQGVKEASVDWTVGVLWGTQRCVPQTMHGRTAAHCGEKYKGQPAKPKSMGNTHSSADGALLGLTHSSINPSVQSCLHLLPFKETSCTPNSILASASGKSNVGQLVPRVTQKKQER